MSGLMIMRFLILCIVPIVYFIVTIISDREKNKLFHFAIPLFYLVIAIIYNDLFVFIEEGEFFYYVYPFVIPIVLTFLFKYIRNRIVYSALIIITAIFLAWLGANFLGMVRGLVNIFYK